MSVGMSSSALLSSDYRLNIFFIYEKRFRSILVKSVFEYFSSVKGPGGTSMTSLDLMRAAVPVFQPAYSNNIRCGSLGGESGGAERSPNIRARRSELQARLFTLLTQTVTGLFLSLNTFFSLHFSHYPSMKLNKLFKSLKGRQWYAQPR